LINLVEDLASLPVNLHTKSPVFTPLREPVRIPITTPAYKQRPALFAGIRRAAKANAKPRTKRSGASCDSLIVRIQDVGFRIQS